MSGLRITGARLLDPVAGTLREGELRIRDGRLVDDLPDHAPSVDAGGKVVAPGFIDLHGAIVSPERDGRAAVQGGFTTVVASPDHPRVLDRVDAISAFKASCEAAPARVLPLGALTLGTQGEALAEIGMLLAAGCVAVGQGASPVASTRVLRHALEYAERVGATVHLRGAEPDLEQGGVIADGPRAVRLGLPGVPSAAEEIGIHRIGALCRLTGARVHVSHVWSAAGVSALRRVRAEGIAVTASTTAWHLGLDPDATGLSPYDGQLRFVPPLGDAGDRAALVDAVLDGVIDGIASDHRPWAAHRKEATIEEVAAGSSSLTTAFALAFAAMGQDLVATVRAFTAGPSRVLGRQPAQLRSGELADLVVLDPQGGTAVPLRPPGNTPLAGLELPGRVVACCVEGQWVHGVVGPNGGIG